MIIIITTIIIYTALLRLELTLKPDPISTVYTGPIAVDLTMTEPLATDRPMVDTLAVESPPTEPSTVNPPGLAAPEFMPTVQGAKVKVPKIFLPQFN